VKQSAQRLAILAAIEQADEPIGPQEIATRTKMKAPNVRQLLGKLVKQDAIVNVFYGRYRRVTPPGTAKPPITAQKLRSMVFPSGCAHGV
jgi:IclR helix-turn-helix domain